MFNPIQYENSEQRLRRIEQHLLLLDVDVKRLWGAVPQTVDQIGGFPINPAVFQVSSSSSSSSEESSSGSSSSESDCPLCVTVDVSAIIGACALANGIWNIPHNVGCDLGSPHYALSNVILEGDEPGAPPRSMSIFADYDKDQERWMVSWDLYLNPGHQYGSYVSDFGVGIDWEGALHHETGCMGVVSITTSLEECPPPSSSSSSEESSSSSSSSSEESTSEASTSEESSSSGASTSEESSSEAPSSSEESSGASSGASSGDSSSGSSSDGPSSGESSSESGGYDPSSGCDADQVAAGWHWEDGWVLDFMNPALCGTPECTTPLLAVPPPDEGFGGLIALRQCDGTLIYTD